MTIAKYNVDSSPFIFAQDSQSKNVELVVVPSNYQVGIKDSPADTTLMGRLSVSTAIYQPNSKNRYTVNLDSFVTVAIIDVIDRQPTTVNLPGAVRNGHIVYVKDKNGMAGSFTITVSANNSKIDGSLTTTISTNYGSKCFCWYVDRWSIISA
jgi:hypothetical protein